MRKTQEPQYTNPRDITIDALIESYIYNGIDFYLHCNWNIVDFGPGAKLPPDVVDDSKNIKVSILRYRVNYKNYPSIIDRVVVCTLSFGGSFRTVRVPFDSVYAVVCVDHEFGVSIPIMVKSEDTEHEDIQPVPKKKGRAKLSVVR